MTPAEQKQAEANGGGLKEIKSEVASNSSSEELPPFQKRSRRKECIYITIAVVLGAGLIAVLVYFSVTNALKASEPEERKNTGAEYSTTESTTPLDYNFDYQTENDYIYSGADVQPGQGMTRDGNTRNQLPGGNPNARIMPSPPEDNTADTGNTEGADQDVQPELKTLRRMPAPGDMTNGDDSGTDAGTSDGQTVAGADQDVQPELKTLRRMPAPGDQTNGDDSGTDAGTSDGQTVAGNTEQEEPVVDAGEESPEPVNPPADDSEAPQTITKALRMPRRIMPEE